MISAEEKQKLVEIGLERFHQSQEFRDLFKWILDEFEKIFKDDLKLKIREQMASLDEKVMEEESYPNALEWVCSLLEEK